MKKIRAFWFVIDKNFPSIGRPDQFISCLVIENSQALRLACINIEYINLAECATRLKQFIGDLVGRPCQIAGETLSRACSQGFLVVAVRRRGQQSVFADLRIVLGKEELLPTRSSRKQLRSKGNRFRARIQESLPGDADVRMLFTMPSHIHAEEESRP